MAFKLVYTYVQILKYDWKDTFSWGEKSHLNKSVWFSYLELSYFCYEPFPSVKMKFYTERNFELLSNA